MSELAATATCLLNHTSRGTVGPTCDWAVSGPVDRVDLEARRHAGERGLKGGPTPGHPVSMHASPPLHPSLATG